jgi:hypothetical protein
MLLLAASRRRGDRVPAAWVHLLRGPISMSLVALAFFVGLLVQGFVIWQGPVERVAAALVSGLIVGLAGIAVRRGSFQPQAVVEIRREPSGRGGFAVLVDGRPQGADVRIEQDGQERTMKGAQGEIDRFSQLRTLMFELPPSAARELRVWVHGVTPEGDSEAIASTVEITDRDGERQIDAPSGSAVVPFDGGHSRLRILLVGAV